jgi:hypothetical protein
MNFVGNDLKLGSFEALKGWLGLGWLLIFRNYFGCWIWFS